MNQLPAPPIPDWIVAQLPATTRRYALAVGEERMHVMEVGAPAGAARPVLLLHGNPTWGFLYRRIAALLADEPLRLIMPDLIGLGFSSKPARAEVHQLEAHGAWLGACLDQLALQDVLFVGQDWGGPIGLRALADRPEMLAGLVLLNTTVGPPRAGFRPTLFHRFSRMPLISGT